MCWFNCNKAYTSRVEKYIDCPEKRGAIKKDIYAFQTSINPKIFKIIRINADNAIIN